MSFSDIEQEVIILNAINELIDTMVNFEVLGLTGNDPDSCIIPKTCLHQRFFSIILADFLSQTDKKIPIKKTSYLSGLKSIANSPSFNRNNSVNSLKKATDEFRVWLNQKVEVETWLPTISINLKLKLSRISFLKICGNISKHNFLRSAGVAQELKDIINNSPGRNAVGFDDALLALGDFYERFHDDIINYHLGTIAEFLNNIRWGIYEYLQPEFKNSIVFESNDHPQNYRYTYPNDINTRIAKECYWELMNDVSRVPYMRRF